MHSVREVRVTSHAEYNLNNDEHVGAIAKMASAEAGENEARFAGSVEARARSWRWRLGRTLKDGRADPASSWSAAPRGKVVGEGRAQREAPREGGHCAWGSESAAGAGAGFWWAFSLSFSCSLRVAAVRSFLFAVHGDWKRGVLSFVRSLV